MTSCLGPWHSSTYPLGPTSRFLLFSPPPSPPPPPLFASRVYTARGRERGRTHTRGEVKIHARFTRAIRMHLCQPWRMLRVSVGVTSLWVNFLSYEEDWMKLKVIDGGYTHGWWNVEFSCGVVVGSDGIFRIFVPMSRQFCRLCYVRCIEESSWELFLGI